MKNDDTFRAAKESFMIWTKLWERWDEMRWDMKLCRTGSACDGRLGSRNYAMMRHGMAWEQYGMAWERYVMLCIRYSLYKQKLMCEDISVFYHIRLCQIIWFSSILLSSYLWIFHREKILNFRRSFLLRNLFIINPD